MENQRKTITFGPVGKYDNLNPQVEPVRCKYADMVAMRDEGKLIPGQLYRITDYVTTVSEFAEPNARSAGHQFDIIVLALDASTLSEDAMAARHDGDEYFANSRLEAWELKYRLDNVQWSLKNGKYVIDEEEGYIFADTGETVEIEGITYFILQGFGSYIEDWGDLAAVTDFHPGTTIWSYENGDLGEEAGQITYEREVETEGYGTIVHMKDEHGNECPYDFKNIQFKRWRASDTVTGRTGLDLMLCIGDTDNIPKGLTLHDTIDQYSYVYTFSSDPSGINVQQDASLEGDSNGICCNIINATTDDILPNNVFFSACHNNICHASVQNNTFIGASLNSFGGDSKYNAVSDGSVGNYFDGTMKLTSIGQKFQYNNVGHDFVSNVIADGMARCIFTAFCRYIDLPKNVRNVSLFEVYGSVNSQLAVSPQTGKNYAQFAAMTSAGVLKIWTPGDLVQ